MKRSKKVLISAACLFFIVLICGSVYVYNRIELILSATNLPQLLESSNQSKISAFNNPQTPESNQDIMHSESTNENKSDEETSGLSESIVSQAKSKENDQEQVNTKVPKQSNASDSTSTDKPSLDSKIASTLEKEAGRLIDTSDMLAAGFILMSKLNNDEINFLFGLSDRKYTTEELKEARKLLLSKLSPQDIEALQSLAGKYGKSLYILDPNAPIK